MDAPAGMGYAQPAHHKRRDLYSELLGVDLIIAIF
jgi:hypothetical protein